MDVKSLTEAARNLARYLEANGEDTSLDVVEAQLQLMKERMRMIRLAKQGKPMLELVKG
jgi:outer membrane protein TolC